MKETTVRTLLSRLTEQLLIYFSEEGQISDSKEFAERLAIATWEGLILFLRQSIANSDEVLLEEVGLLRKVDDQWLFEPAASLTEVDAMKLPALKEHQYLAQKALFHLNQGTELLASIPADQEMSSTASTAEERLLRTVFNVASTDEQKLSGRISLIADQLVRTLGRLQGRRQIQDRLHLSATGIRQTRGEQIQARGEAGKYYEGTMERAGEYYDISTGKAGEMVQHGVLEREPAPRYRDFAAGVEAGKKAYQEEKRKTELSGRAETPGLISTES